MLRLQCGVAQCHKPAPLLRLRRSESQLLASDASIQALRIEQGKLREEQALHLERVEFISTMTGLSRLHPVKYESFQYPGHMDLSSYLRQVDCTAQQSEEWAGHTIIYSTNNLIIFCIAQGSSCLTHARYVPKSNVSINSKSSNYASSVYVYASHNYVLVGSKISRLKLRPHGHKHSQASATTLSTYTP